MTDYIDKKTLWTTVLAGLILSSILAISSVIYSYVNSVPWIDVLWSMWSWIIKTLNFNLLLWIILIVFLGIGLYLFRRKRTQPQPSIKSSDKREDIIYLGSNTTSGSDDDWFHEVLDLDHFSYSFKILKVTGEYWRIGFKLGRKQLIPTNSKQNKGYPLIHLEKKTNEDDHVRMVVFDETGDRRWYKPIDNFPIGKPFELRIDKIDDFVKVAIYSQNKEFIHNYRHQGGYSAFDVYLRYAKLIGFADGNPFEFEVLPEKTPRTDR